MFPNTSGAADRPCGEDERGVPRRDRADDTDGLADGHRHRARHVGRQDLAERRVCGAGRLTEETGDESHLEHAETEARPGLAGEPADDLVAPELEDVRRLEEDALPHGGGRLRPRRERRGRSVDRALGVGARTRRDAGDGLLPVNGSRSSKVRPSDASDPFAADELCARRARCR